jgi:pimeloyl-ACP methyl ester carboxylesterase
MPRASLTVVPNAGHLLHEELPAFAARFVLDAAERAGIVTADGATAAASTP